MEPYPTLEHARLAFAEYADLEPQLVQLWELCELASPPVRTYDEEDEDNYDLQEIDPAEGWCAELHYFTQEVKPHLIRLVGRHRKEGPAELQTHEAYIAVYRALINHALRRLCDCCRGRQAIH